MAALDVVFTLAMPVHVARLGAHFEAYKDSLPGLNALRACNRFGSGPQCHINKLPVELIQRISDYYILPPREEQIARWNACLLCYENRCDTDSHYTREQALEMWHSCCLSDPCSCSGDPDDEDLWEFVAEFVSDGGETHGDRKNEWEMKTQVFLQREGRSFQKHFGLSIWLSKVYVGYSDWCNGSSDTTTAYLILPNRATCSKEWDRHISEDGYAVSSYESGYGMVVAPYQQATSKEIQHFKRVMKVLDLDLFVHFTQEQDKALSLAPMDKVQGPAAMDQNTSAASFPRPMLLIHDRVDVE